MYQLIELLNTQVADFELENPLNNKIMMDRLMEKENNQAKYFSYTIHSCCFCVKISKKNWIEKKKYNSNTNKNHIMKNTGTINSFQENKTDIE